MKIALPQPILADLIARGGVAAAKKSPLPILSHVRLTASDGELALASCDMDRFAEATANAQVDMPGALCVDAQAFATLIGKHPKSGLVTLTLDGEFLLVACGRSKVKLPTLSASNFPAWADHPPMASFPLAADQFGAAIGKVRFAASTSKARPHLQGIYFDVDDGKMHFVAFDGFAVLAVCGIEAPEGSADCPKVIVPVEAIDAATTVFAGAARIDVGVSDRAISFSADCLRLSCKLIAGTFPPYTQIIPARGNPSVKFKRADMVDCLDRANDLAGDGVFNSIVIRPDGETLHLESRNHTGGEANEELDGSTTGDVRPFGFIPKQVAAFLAKLRVGEMVIEQTDPNKPHLIYSDDAPDFVGVLSPVRVAA